MIKQMSYELEALTEKIQGLTEEQAIKKTFDIMVFPRKEIFIKKYNEKTDFNQKLFDEMINNFNNPKLFKPFGDKSHEFEKKYFDILDLFSETDGLYANIKLNKSGYEAIKNREFSYISPAFGRRTDTDGTEYSNVLSAITLTNIPALEGELPQLQEQIKLTKKINGGQEMDLETLQANFTALENNVKELNTKLDTKTNEGQAVGLLREAMTQLTVINGAKESAEKKAIELSTELTGIKNEKKEAEKKVFLDTALKAGKFEASALENWSVLYDSNNEMVVKMLNATPEISEGQLTTPGTNLENAEYKKFDFESKEDYGLALDHGVDMKNREQIKSFKLNVLDDGGK